MGRATTTGADLHEAGQVPRRGRLLAAVLALLVGVAGGYLLRWGTGPTKTKTVIKTVTAPAYTTSMTPTAQAYFDGSHCSYSGPAELQAGSKLTVAFTTSTPGAALAVYMLSPAPTWETYVRDIVGPTQPSFLNPTQPPRQGSRTSTTTMSPGVYGVFCGTADSVFYGGDAKPVVATMLRVIP